MLGKHHKTDGVFFDLRIIRYTTRTSDLLARGFIVGDLEWYNK